MNRKTYSPKEKTEILNFLKNNTINSTIRKYNIGRNTIKYWRNDEYRIKSIKRADAFQRNHKERHKENTRKYFNNNKEKVHKINQQYYLTNKEIITKKHIAYMKNRKKTDIEYRILCNLRNRLYHAVSKQSSQKSMSTKLLVGCNLINLQLHLESLFKDGMSWDNYGRWHIDHIKPCCAFNLTEPCEQQRCFHYTNLQPLWAEDNLKKNASYEY